MTAALAPAAALVGLALSLGAALPATTEHAGPAPAPVPAPAVSARHAWIASYERDTTAAVTAAAKAASRVAARTTVGVAGADAAKAGPLGLGISCGGRSWPMSVKSRIMSLFGVSQIGGYRPGGGDHSAGLALDVMVGGNKTLGDRVARWSQANAKALNIKYVIWYQRIWFPGKSMTEWRTMGDRGGATANHIDHVHLSFNPGKGSCG